jgi:hypothetical protein
MGGWTSEEIPAPTHFGETLGSLVGPHTVLLHRELDWNAPI